ncbi:uncharacterized protein LOC141527257 isoform X2 [Cotesia typhae]|uniref:uncharacterized protein LOC141527257 isoform X2 n=1 Tax=Cotesia typhae TaxID=2053667 RepID=UPI003D68A6B2
MGRVNFLNVIAAIYCLTWQSTVYGGYVKLTHDGPTVQGGIITFQADLYYSDGTRPSGIFAYFWRDNAVPPHTYQSQSSENTTSIWRVQYPADLYPVGEYTVEVKVERKILIFYPLITSQHKTFEISPLLNGNLTIVQPNNTAASEYISSASEAEILIKLRKGDADYIEANATEITTYWFVDCKYYGQTNDFSFRFNFTKPETEASLEALVVASYDPPTTVAPTTSTTAPTTTTTTTTTSAPPSNGTIPSNSTTTTTTTTTPTTTPKSIVTTTLKPTVTTPSTNSSTNATIGFKNISLSYVCVNTSLVPPDPKKTYGYFQKQIKVRAPIKNITVEGTNWIKPWDLLSLNVKCHGSGPFYKCLQYHRGNYNITGNETCDNGEKLNSCNFSISHYFLDPTVYTILIILKNDVSVHVYPLTINIYEATAKPQLSVIVVPVSCTLAAVVLIVFGIAYYLQSRARFTVEVADFDFGQSNPEMEYKTFTERLRDSFNSTGYKQLGDPKTIQN